jgi:hypothetical protein
MHEIKTGTGRPSFWCGILTGEQQAAPPPCARTVRGPYTASSLANTQRDKSGNPAKGTPHGEGREKD